MAIRKKPLTKKQRKTLRLIEKIGMGLAYFAFVYTVAVPFYLTKVDGWLFPVITPLDIFTVEAVPGGTLISGRIERLRPECDFEGIDWYLGTRSGTSTLIEGVQILNDQKDRGNPNNAIIYALLLVDASPEQVLTRSFADTHYSDCYWLQPPWTLVEMPLYEGIGQDAHLVANYLSPRIKNLEEQVLRLQEEQRILQSKDPEYHPNFD